MFKDVINDVYCDWVVFVEMMNYIFGIVVGLYFFLVMVCDFQKIIGEEVRVQLFDEVGCFFDVVVVCVGGGFNVIGMFDVFFDDEGVVFYGVEVVGDGVDIEKYVVLIECGCFGVLYGVKIYVLQDVDGQIIELYLIFVGFDYFGVGFEYLWLVDIGCVQYILVIDDEVMQVLCLFSWIEGIIFVIEFVYVFVGVFWIGWEFGLDGLIVVCFLGCGDKDMDIVVWYFEFYDEVVFVYDVFEESVVEELVLKGELQL